MAEIVGRANVEPCSVDRVVDYFAPVGNEHLYEVGCVKDSVVGDAVEQRAPHDVDSRVGVVVVGWLFLQSEDAVAFASEYGERHRHHVWNRRDCHIGLFLDVLQEHVLIAYCGKQVGVHYQHIVVRQPVDKLGCSDCAEFAWFAHAAHVDAAHRTREMLIELLCEVVGRDGNVSHPVPGKSLHVVVDDALVADFEQRLWGGQCQRRSLSPRPPAIIMASSGRMEWQEVKS